MSYQAVEWVLTHSQSTGSERMVLVVIAHQSHDDGTNSYPSIEKLAQKANISERMVQYHIASLIKRGEITVSHVPGMGKLNVYAIAGMQEGYDATDCVTHDATDCASATGFVTQSSVPMTQSIASDDAIQRIPMTQSVVAMTQYNVKHDATDCVQNNTGIKEKESLEQPKKNPVNNPHAQAREALALLGPMATDAEIEYQTFEDFFNAFWSAYNKKVDKAACKLYARSIEPIQWTAVVNGALSYALSSIATKEGGKWKRNPLNWLEGECWEAYQDGPVIDQPPGLVMNGMQQESAAIRSMVDAASSMFGSVEEITEMYRPKGGVNYAWREPVRRSSRLDEVRRRGVRQAIDGDFRQVSEGFAFPDP